MLPGLRASPGISFAGVAASCGYASSLETDDLAEIRTWLQSDPLDGPRFACLSTHRGTAERLPRPSVTPVDVKARLMQHFPPPDRVV